ncbi:MAG: 50S ribosomal protein L11 methyltransferase [Bdellovibrionales bacterium]|nr:50S ribosomal protein L11 methyltransferase [Bdellovibrionales bacterium]
MEKTYYHLLIKQCLRKEEEELAHFCFENGALGLSEVLAFTQRDPSNYEPQTLITEKYNLEVFFDQRPEDLFFIQLKENFQFVSYSENIEPDKDWLEEWKKGFAPFELVKDIWIVPDWCEAPTAAKKIIWLEPGMAFGTGTHETTQLVAEILSQSPLRSEDVLLDVGTGSGLLCMLASHLGISHSLGIDVDSEAVRVAKENVVKNNMSSSIEISDIPLADVQQKYTWVVANIIDGVLLKLKADLLDKMEPGGFLILSGILEERWPHFQQEFIADTGLKLLECKQKGDWLGVLLHA